MGGYAGFGGGRGGVFYRGASRTPELTGVDFGDGGSDEMADRMGCRGGEAGLVTSS